MSKSNRIKATQLAHNAAYMSERTAFLDNAHITFRRLVKVLREDGHPRLAVKVARLAMDTHPCILSDEAEYYELKRLGIRRRR